MTPRSAVTQKVTDIRRDGARADSEEPRKIIAYFVNPACEHDWGKLSKDLQTLEAEGKLIWKCRSCGKIASTYDWQTP